MSGREIVVNQGVSVVVVAPKASFQCHKSFRTSANTAMSDPSSFGPAPRVVLYRAGVEQRMGREASTAHLPQWLRGLCRGGGDHASMAWKMDVIPCRFAAASVRCGPFPSVLYTHLVVSCDRARRIR